MNRADFQKLAELRIREAKILLDNKQYAGAYYLAGYSVEYALKACIARQTKRYAFPPDVERVRKMYIHDLTRLLEPAGIQKTHAVEVASNRMFNANWTTAKDWSEQSRYEHSITRARALDLYSAITDSGDGILTWLKNFW
ncbi:MAG: HEPN domain-containing protein [Chloroflexota bacterium]|nr:HEPN domain-containing protein [Chloroflexota bacterium]